VRDLPSLTGALCQSYANEVRLRDNETTAEDHGCYREAQHAAREKFRSHVGSLSIWVGGSRWLLPFQVNHRPFLTRFVGAGSRAERSHILLVSLRKMTIHQRFHWVVAGAGSSVVRTDSRSHELVIPGHANDTSSHT
jgi:hypothetical protein